MATWNDVCHYVHSRYNVADEGRGYVWLDFRLSSGRTQIVQLTRAAMNGSQNQEWVKIQSPIAKIGEVNLLALLEGADQYLVGGVVSDGDFLLLRHSILLGDMSVDEFEFPLDAIFSAADKLEAKFRGADIF